MFSANRTIAPAPVALSDGEFTVPHREWDDATPPVITMVSTHGTSESSIRVTLRPGTESGVSVCGTWD